MSLWDKVKSFTQPYSDDEYDEFDEEETTETYEEQQEPVRPRRRPGFGFAAESEPEKPATSTATAASTGFSGQVVGTVGGKQEVVLFHAKTFDDAAKAADELRKKKAVILNMENVDKALTRRVVDFLSGSVYALDGSVKKIAQSTYLFCPNSMDVAGELEAIQAEPESNS